MSHCLNKPPAVKQKKGYQPLAEGEEETITEIASQLRYGSMSNPSKAAPASAQEAWSAAPQSVAPTDAAHEAILRGVARAITDRIQSEASVSDNLLDEKDTLSATAVYMFAWRKPGNEADGTPAKPEAVTFSKDALNRMFAGKVDLSKPQYVHSATIVEAKNPSSFPLNLTMDGIQGGPVECEFANDGSACTMLLLPKSHFTGEREIYRLRDVDPEKLRTHGNANLQEEVDSLTAVPDSDHVLVQPKSRIGRILKKNEHLVSDTGSLDVLDEATIPMYAVKESTVLEILELFNSKVIESLPKTNFLEHSATLTRADRTQKEADIKEFADATDAPNMSRAAVEAAHREKHAVYVKVRFNVIDPAKLEQRD